MATIYLGLGSNTPDKVIMLSRARLYIKIYIGSIKKSSLIYESSPWGYFDQADFINQVIAVSTSLTVKELLWEIRKIETIMKKQKTIDKYGPRNIDIDILLYEDVIISKHDLQIPHARMHKRNFVLIPLAEIAPEVIHPVFKLKIEDLRIKCKDSGTVKPHETTS